MIFSTRPLYCAIIYKIKKNELVEKGKLKHLSAKKMYCIGFN